MTADHQRYDELAVGWALHALEPADEAEFARHLPGCARCAEIVAETTEVMGALATDLPPVAPSEGLRERLRAALAWLPPVLGGAPRQPLEVGRATRVVHPAQRAALAVRDGGCVFPGCDRPLAWCDAHHLWHWVDGGPTDLSNLAMVCRAHHRRVHEEGWRLIRGPDGRFTVAPPVGGTGSSPDGRSRARRAGSRMVPRTPATVPGDRMGPERARPEPAA
jgi:hypothetical protein